MGLSDAEIISNMMRRAKAEGMWLEVQESFQICREAGYSVLEASQCALYDWDC